MDKKDKNNNENKMDQLRLNIPQIDEEATRTKAEKFARTISHVLVTSAGGFFAESDRNIQPCSAQLFE